MGTLFSGNINCGNFLELLILHKEAGETPGAESTLTVLLLECCAWLLCYSLHPEDVSPFFKTKQKTNLNTALPSFETNLFFSLPGCCINSVSALFCWFLFIGYFVLKPKFIFLNTENIHHSSGVTHQGQAHSRELKSISSPKPLFLLVSYLSF